MIAPIRPYFKQISEQFLVNNLKSSDTVPFLRAGYAYLPHYILPAFRIIKRYKGGQEECLIMRRNTLQRIKTAGIMPHITAKAPE
jgi:hypothetical protein